MYNRSHKLGLLKDYDLDKIITTRTGKMIFEMTMEDTHFIKGVKTRSMVDALFELCSPFLKGGNSVFIAAIARGLFPQNENESRSLE